MAQIPQSFWVIFLCFLVLLPYAFALEQIIDVENTCANPNSNHCILQFTITTPKTIETIFLPADLVGSIKNINSDFGGVCTLNTSGATKTLHLEHTGTGSSRTIQCTFYLAEQHVLTRPFFVTTTGNTNNISIWPAMYSYIAHPLVLTPSPECQVANSSNVCTLNVDGLRKQDFPYIIETTHQLLRPDTFQFSRRASLLNQSYDAMLNDGCEMNIVPISLNTEGDSMYRYELYPPTYGFQNSNNNGNNNNIAAAFAQCNLYLTKSPFTYFKILHTSTIQAVTPTHFTMVTNGLLKTDYTSLLLNDQSSVHYFDFYMDLHDDCYDHTDSRCTLVVEIPKKYDGFLNKFVYNGNNSTQYDINTPYQNQVQNHDGNNAIRIDLRYIDPITRESLSVFDPLFSWLSPITLMSPILTNCTDVITTPHSSQPLNWRLGQDDEYVRFCTMYRKSIQSAITPPQIAKLLRADRLNYPQVLQWSLIHTHLSSQMVEFNFFHTYPSHTIYNSPYLINNNNQLSPNTMTLFRREPIAFTTVLEFIWAKTVCVDDTTPTCTATFKSKWVGGNLKVGVDGAKMVPFLRGLDRVDCLGTQLIMNRDATIDIFNIDGPIVNQECTVRWVMQYYQPADFMESAWQEVTFDSRNINNVLSYPQRPQILNEIQNTINQVNRGEISTIEKNGDVANATLLASLHYLYKDLVYDNPGMTDLGIKNENFLQISFYREVSPINRYVKEMTSQHLHPLVHLPLFTATAEFSFAQCSTNLAGCEYKVYLERLKPRYHHLPFQNITLSPSCEDPLEALCNITLYIKPQVELHAANHLRRFSVYVDGVDYDKTITNQHYQLYAENIPADALTISTRLNTPAAIKSATLGLCEPIPLPWTVLQQQIDDNSHLTIVSDVISFNVNQGPLYQLGYAPMTIDPTKGQVVSIEFYKALQYNSTNIYQNINPWLLNFAGTEVAQEHRLDTHPVELYPRKYSPQYYPDYSLEFVHEYCRDSSAASCPFFIHRKKFIDETLFFTLVWPKEGRVLRNNNGDNDPSGDDKALYMDPIDLITKTIFNLKIYQNNNITTLTGDEQNNYYYAIELTKDMTEGTAIPILFYKNLLTFAKASQIQLILFTFDDLNTKEHIIPLVSSEQEVQFTNVPRPSFGSDCTNIGSQYCTLSYPLTNDLYSVVESKTATVIYVEDVDINIGASIEEPIIQPITYRLPHNGDEVIILEHEMAIAELINFNSTAQQLTLAPNNDFWFTYIPVTCEGLHPDFSNLTAIAYWATEGYVWSESIRVPNTQPVMIRLYAGRNFTSYPTHPSSTTQHQTFVDLFYIVKHALTDQQRFDGFHATCSLQLEFNNYKHQRAPRTFPSIVYNNEFPLTIRPNGARISQLLGFISPYLTPNNLGYYPLFIGTNADCQRGGSYQSFNCLLPVILSGTTAKPTRKVVRVYDPTATRHSFFNTPQWILRDPKAPLPDIYGKLEDVIKHPNVCGRAVLVSLSFTDTSGIINPNAGPSGTPISELVLTIDWNPQYAQSSTSCYLPLKYSQELVQYQKLINDAQYQATGIPVYPHVYDNLTQSEFKLTFFNEFPDLPFPMWDVDAGKQLAPSGYIVINNTQPRTMLDAWAAVIAQDRTAARSVVEREFGKWYPRIDLQTMLAGPMLRLYGSPQKWHLTAEELTAASLTGDYAKSALSNASYLRLLQTTAPALGITGGHDFQLTQYTFNVHMLSLIVNFNLGFSGEQYVPCINIRSGLDEEHRNDEEIHLYGAGSQLPLTIFEYIRIMNLIDNKRWNDVNKKGIQDGDYFTFTYNNVLYEVVGYFHQYYENTDIHTTTTSASTVSSVLSSHHQRTEFILNPNKYATKTNYANTTRWPNPNNVHTVRDESCWAFFPSTQFYPTHVYDVAHDAEILLMQNRTQYGVKPEFMTATHSLNYQAPRVQSQLFATRSTSNTVVSYAGGSEQSRALEQTANKAFTDEKLQHTRTVSTIPVYFADGTSSLDPRTQDGAGGYWPIHVQGAADTKKVKTTKSSLSKNKPIQIQSTPITTAQQYTDNGSSSGDDDNKTNIVLIGQQFELLNDVEYMNFNALSNTGDIPNVEQKQTTAVLNNVIDQRNNNNNGDSDITTNGTVQKLQSFSIFMLLINVALVAIMTIQF